MSFFILRWLTGSWEYLIVITVIAIVAYIVKECQKSSAARGKAKAEADRQKMIASVEKDFNDISDALGQFRSALVRGYSVPAPAAPAEIEDDGTQRRINYLTKRLVILDNKKDKLDYLGTDPKSKQYRGLIYDIDSAKRELEYLQRS